MSRLIQFGDVSEKAILGDTVRLQDGVDREVVNCEKTGVPMLNIDADQIAMGDLRFIKKIGLTISNPDTDKPIALGVDYVDDSFGHKVHDYFTKDTSDDDDDDSSFFSGSSFGGGISLGGFGGGGFGGFGGGGFGGGGASGGF